MIDSCHPGGMARKSEPAWRRMTRRQRAVAVAGGCLALVGLVLALAVNAAVGAMILAAASLVIIFAQVFAPPDPPRG